MPKQQVKSIVVVDSTSEKDVSMHPICEKIAGRLQEEVEYKCTVAQVREKI